MKNTVAAIDFGTSKIVTVIAASNSVSRFDIIGSGRVPYGGFCNGYWKDDDDLLIDEIHDSITAAETDSKTSIDEIYVGIPGEYIHVLTKEAEVDISSENKRVTQEDIDAVMDAAADLCNLADLDDCVVLHRSYAYLSVDGGKSTMEWANLKGSRLKALVTFITADLNFVEAACELFNDLHISIAGFLSPLMGQMLRLIDEEERDRGAILIDSGHLNTEISLIRGDAVVQHAVLPLGVSNITRDLSYTFNISYVLAEQLKRGYMFIPDEFEDEVDPQVYDESGSRISFPRDAVKRCVDATMNDLIDMIEGTLEEWEKFVKPRTTVYLTGGGIPMLRGGKEYLSQRLSRTIKVPVNKGTKLSSPDLSSTAGLIQLIFESIENTSPQSETLPGKVFGSVKNILKKK